MPVSVRNTKSVIILALLIFFQLVLISIQVPRGDDSTIFEGIVFSIFSPIKHGTESFFQGVASIWKNYFGLHRAQKDNRRLRQEVARLRQENSLLKGILRTYKTEKRMTELLMGLEENILPVRVIGLDASNIWKSLVVNKGSLDGVRKDMVVLDRHGYLVGRVVEPVSFRQSRVQMITDTESGVHVTPQGKDVAGIINGIGNGKCNLEYILATDTLVEEGDSLVTTGIDGMYMPGILVGHVVSVETDISLFKGIRVIPAIKIQSLDVLAVITADVNEFF